MYVVAVAKGISTPAVSAEFTRLKFGQYWADGWGNSTRYQNNLIALVVWAANEKQPLYFDFHTALWSQDRICPQWHKVEAEDVVKIYRQVDIFGASVWTQVLERLYKDALMNQ